jgi:putrescine---pyruvate transaminase
VWVHSTLHRVGPFVLPITAPSRVIYIDSTIAVRACLHGANIMSAVSSNVLLETLKQHSQSQWHPMSSPMLNRKLEELVIERGEGVYVWDINGTRYFDAMSGLWCVNVGHGRSEVKAAIVAQLDKLEFHNTFGTMNHPGAIRLAERITQLLSTEEMKRVFFSSGGSDAVETAIKLARQYWRVQGRAERVKFISLRTGYHGMHIGGTSLSGSPLSRAAFGPGLADCYQVETPHLYRNPWTRDAEELGEICAALLEREIQHQKPDTVAAFIAEPVIGIGGVIVPPRNYWPRVREICDKYGVLLIADEVVSGFGRTGAVTGSRGWGVKPDIMCLAKGLTSGYIPMGATTVNAKVADAIEAAPPPAGMLMHGYTYSGHPVAAAAALACLDIVEKENLPENAATVGQYLLEGLQTLHRFAHVGDIRGKGLMVAIELVENKKTHVPLSPTSPFGQQIGRAAGQHGALVRSVGNLIILSPPLISTRNHIGELLKALEAAFTAVDTVG